MPLEHFKTQVLLLHSQQSTLDALSAGFGNRYAVHLATSGSAALNTLGETPIHVIVSAQDLPGMSGLEALREAKKRSPETIGILLAGSARDDGLEALVTDQEVFQIVRGAVTPESLMQLIDQATKRVRLLTIAESANDQAADVDEPAGEHIVMETSENGATIISDGTGRMRALRPQNIQLASHVGGREVDVLVLTKDEEFLATIRESSRGLHNVHHANTLGQAEAIIKSHKVGILVTDAAMIGSDIESIAGRLRAVVPRLVAIVAGRRDDGELLMDLINRGQVYRFLLKPVSPGRARLAIEASVKHHLEAADSAFRGKSGGADTAPASARTAPQSANPRAAKAAVAKAQPPKSPIAKPPAAKKSAEVISPADRVEPVVRPATSPQPAAPQSPVAQAATDESITGLDSAFGDSGRFTRTMTGLAATAGKSVSNASGTVAQAAKGLLQPKILTIGATAIAAGALIAWWLSRPDIPAAESSDVAASEAAAPQSMPSFVETEVLRRELQALPEASPPDATSVAPPYQALLEKARIAREEGEIIAPAGNNAIELYVAALQLAPDEPLLVTELGETVDDALALVEQALLEQRGSEADAGLRLVRLADPQNARLGFLSAQASQLELRRRLDEARTAMRDARFEDAARAIAAAGSAGADTAEVNALSEELARVRSEQRVDDVLTLAGQRLAEDALVSPANDNARYYFERALSNDADNTAAQQGLAMVASKLVLRAREAIDAGRLDEAERLLQDAGNLDSGSSELAASAVALTTARAAQQEAALQLQAEEQAALEQQTAIIVDDGILDDVSLETQSGNDADVAANEAAGSDATLRDRSFAQPATAMRRTSQPVAGGATPVPSAERSDAAPSGTASRSAARDSGASEADSSEFVAISALQRTNYVAPRYPRVAQRRGITGWVDVSFTVTADGGVTNIEIMNAEPAELFNDSASDAVAEWRFEPPTRDGMPVSQRVAVRMMFSLQ